MAANVWTNANASTTTAWTAGGDTSTAWEESHGSNNLLVDNSQQYSTVGTFSSVAKATTSIVGSKYHLLDNKEFFLGTDKDFTFSFSTSTNGFNISSVVASDKFFSITKGSSNLMILDSDGDLKIDGAYDTPTVKTTASLSESPDSGSLTFYNDDLYLAR